MTEDMFKQIKEQIMVDDFGVEIVDGKMIISPSESGVILLSALTTQQTELENAEQKLIEIDDYLLKIVDENDTFRDLLEDCLNTLDEYEQEELIKRINKQLWRVSGVLADGTEIQIDMKEELDNV